jgi:hypothetical protein
VLPVQSEAEVKVNENAIKWVAEQTAGQAIAEGITERDRSSGFQWLLAACDLRPKWDSANFQSELGILLVPGAA